MLACGCPSATTQEAADTASQTARPAEEKSDAQDGNRDSRALSPNHQTIVEFPNSRMLLELPDGIRPTPPQAPETAYEVKLSGATIWLNEHGGFPDTAETHRDRLGGETLRSEEDQEHSALASRGSSRDRNKDAIEVWGFAPGLWCQGKNVTPKTLDDVFSICSSIRRVGSATAYPRLPEISEEPALGMETRRIETDQFAITRVKWSKFSCDFLLKEITSPERERHVETRDAARGPIRIWWEVLGDRGEVGRTTGWAERGEYCCGFNTAWWFHPLTDEDYAPLIEACDNVELDGWPEKLLPEPVK